MDLHRSGRLLLILAILCLAASPPAAAGSAPAPATVAALKGGASGHLLGNWNGLRATLHDTGIDLGLSYLGEAAWNVAGGKRTGADYAGQEKLTLDLDFGKIASLHGLSLHIALINRNGRNASTDYVGDDLLQAQEIYGAGGDVFVHLAYLYLEQKLRNGAIDLKAGRLAVAHDFGTLPDGCDFMALAVCANWGLGQNVGWTTFPVATWGGNAKIKLTPHLTVGTGVYEVNPRVGQPSGFYWALGGAEGAMVPVELDWKTRFGDRLPGVYKLGAYFDSTHYADWYTAANGMPLPLTSAPARRSQRAGFYILAQQMVLRTGSQPGQGLTVLAGYERGDPDNTLFTRFAFVGLLFKGLVSGRPNDRTGLSFVHLRVSSDLTAVQALQASLGAPLARSAPGVETTESLVEANYDFAFGHGIDVMPDVQYVLHPSASTRYANALVLGLQVKVRF